MRFDVVVDHLRVIRSQWCFSSHIISSPAVRAQGLPREYQIHGSPRVGGSLLSRDAARKLFLALIISTTTESSGPLTSSSATLALAPNQLNFQQVSHHPSCHCLSPAVLYFMIFSFCFLSSYTSPQCLCNSTFHTALSSVKLPASSST